jgi:MFS family permease
MNPSDPYRRDIIASNADGGGYSLMVGLGETYFAAFAIAVQFSDAAVGLLTTVPMMAGSVVQLISPTAVGRLASVRGWTVLTVVVQALSFVPLVLMAAFHRAPAWLVFAAITFYWAGGQAAGATWVTWMERVIPPRLRARFFAGRARTCQACTLIGLAVGGLTLQAASTRHMEVSAFVLLFGVAALGRLFSAGSLLVQSATSIRAHELRTVSLVEMGGRIRHAADGRLLIYLAALQTGAQLAGPYFAPFMLSRLQFSYAEYMVLIATFYLTKVVASPPLGRLVPRIGAKRLLWIGGLGIVPLAAAWIVSSSFWYLLLVQVASGIAWAAHELASPLLYFEMIPERERTSVLTVFNLMNATAMASGAVIGGAVLHALGANVQAYYMLFALSSLTRLAAIPLLARVRTATAHP